MPAEAAGARCADPAAAAPAAAAAPDARLRGLVAGHFDFIWRSLRRLGVPATDVDDCAQQVFWVAAQKLSEIQPGRERAFLYGTAMRVASDARKRLTRRREVAWDDDLEERRDPGLDPEQMAQQRRARALLDEVLDTLAMDLRSVFVLFEIEEMTVTEIAEILELPSGTVASRLRRAREEFQRIVTRLKARGVLPGGER